MCVKYEYRATLSLQKLGVVTTAKWLYVILCSFVYVVGFWVVIVLSFTNIMCFLRI